MDQKKLDRINELAAKMKTVGLTEEEAAERKQLHKEYIEAYRANLRGILENTYIQRPDGTREKLVKKDKE
ncbi:MAG: DUF896 domain-containing protein [Clostridia bacterium]|nr:DUF896 domain-containing protein [Clostridia bacterium]MBQ1259751.1 DUF896 domain-containing protein [Clostridia bacterium]